MADNYFMGHDGFSWFIGVVEDRNDPKKAGRVRVRCLGHHSENIIDIPTNELPWASIMNPVTAGGNSGIGVYPHFLIEGTWVVGFFRDPAKQEPVIMGALPGFNTTEITNETIASSSETGGQSTKGGFRDPRYSNNPNEEYALRVQRGIPRWGREKCNIADYGNYPRPNYLGRPDTNMLAYGVVTQHDSSNADVSGSTEQGDYASSKSHGEHWTNASGAAVIQPMSTRTKAEYPYNHVFESESGHYVAFDDTEGNERIEIFHRKGTFIEIDNDGNIVVKTLGNITNIVTGNMDTLVRGNYSLTVDGNMDVWTMGNLTELVDGDRKTTILGTETVEITGAVDQFYESTLDLSVMGDVTNTFEASLKTDIVGTASIKSGFAMTIGGSSISFN